MSATPAYLQPGRIGTLTLPNRVVRGATSETMASSSGVVYDSFVELYRRLAEGGAGLLLTGHMYVDPRGQASANQTGIHDDRVIPALARATEAVHEAGGRIFAQIGHCGSQTMMSTITPVAPSPVPNAMYTIQPVELTTGEIGELVGGLRIGGPASGRGRIRRHPHPRRQRLPHLGVLLAPRQHPRRRVGRRRRAPQPLLLRGRRGGARRGRRRASRDRPPQRGGFGPRWATARRVAGASPRPGRAGDRRLRDHLRRHAQLLREHPPVRGRGARPGVAQPAGPAGAAARRC